MKIKTLRGLSVFSFTFLVISTVLLFLLGLFNPTLDETFLLLFAFGWCCAWVPLSLISSLWLIYTGRGYLKNAFVWLGFQGLFLLALFGSQSSFPAILLVAATCFFVMLPLLGVVNFIYAYQHYLALSFMAIGSAGFVWFILIAWRIYGNLFDVWLSAIDSNNNTLLWLNGVMALTGWMFIAGSISFCVETFQSLRREFVVDLSA